MPRVPRRDAFDTYLRQVMALKGPQDSEYDRIQTQWAKARQRRDEFFRRVQTLERRIGGLEVDVRPVLGHTPPRLKLIVTIPEGITARKIQKAEATIAAWRTELTKFQGPTAFVGIEPFGKVEPNGAGQTDSHRFVLSKTQGPAAIAEALNRSLADHLTEAVALENVVPPDDPPFNSEWRLSEARDLMQAWKINPADQEIWIREALQRLRNRKPAFASVQRGRSPARLDGPFTDTHVKNYLDNWRNRNRSHGM
ncbi:hypothetical protein DNFV4_02757 [Nitrospira tepida]|uniref:Uncharacterized protein n=1 Tax=Nitrospira tepida TaxID=2973512 RepID=A0AA86T622_9BACT|nr:hypothetical protein [Nitrospira tepida]CAI4032327.1 hypothetical protein DNFV4_02757 [Nitrospira tepida]